MNFEPDCEVNVDFGLLFSVFLFNMCSSKNVFHIWYIYICVHVQSALRNTHTQLYGTKSISVCRDASYSLFLLPSFSCEIPTVQLERWNEIQKWQMKATTPGYYLFINKITRWWFQACFFKPRSLGRWSNLTCVFFSQMGGGKTTK